MPELTREEKLKLIEKLPQQLQDFLYSEDLGAFLFHLRYKYNLIEDKVSALARAIANIVLGIVPMTGLLQEIIDKKIVADAQIAANIAQEVNTELLAPIMAAPTTPLTPTVPSADHYREPTAEAPQIIDLRKTPVTPAQSAPSVAPSVPVPKPIIPTQLIVPKPVIPVPLAAPTPLKPVELIEAEPHKIPPFAPRPIISTPKPIDAYREPTKTQSPPLVSAPIPTSTPPASESKPQYIMRPSGAPPTDLPDNVLDLRKDKGEF